MAENPTSSANVRFEQVAVLASGSGTILQAILDRGDIPVALVVVDRPCGAVEIAKQHGVASEVLVRTDFSPTFDRLAYTHRVVDALERYGIELVVMAGFGTILDKPVHDAYANRILNTHPALLPAFKGWHAVPAALEAGVKVTGCTVHLATLEVDDGPILAQVAVDVRDDDTVETLHERIKQVERRLYPDVIAGVIAGRIALPV